ncbi:MAG: Ig-like domain-containing protein [Desulfobacteraceae bacterium]
MKKEFLTCIGVGLLVCLLPASLWAWCWIRDTGPTDTNCDAGLYQEDCCDGELRKWLDGTMTYRISDSTDSTLMDLIEDGMNKWNEIEMSTFEFDRGTETTTAVISLGDGENTIVIDPNFCTSYAAFIDSQDCPYILGISGTWVPASNSGLPFQALESDIALNDQSFDWDDGTDHQNTVAVIAHEAGHSAGLTHPGDDCLASGSSGCGAGFPEATMYWAYDVSAISEEPDIDKATLELDDIAALVYGYPKSTVCVRVLTNEGSPQRIIGATVDLLDSAAPVNGSSIAEGGSVYGDVTNAAVLFGEDSPSQTYVNATPFNDTNADGETNDINPIHENLRVRVTAGSLTPVTQAHTVVSGENTVIVTLDTTETDFAGPTVAVTSHTSGQAVAAANITLTGTATDSGRGGSGISQVTVNGEVAVNGTAVGDGVANWRKDDITLDEGANTLKIVAYDNKSAGEINTSTLFFSITYDTTPPTVSRASPADGATGVAVNANFGVAFSEAMDPSTINTSNFKVDNGVTGTIVYNSGSNLATFVPSAPLAEGTTYTATVTTGVRDAVGLPMAANFTWSITTSDPTGGSGDGGGGGACFIGSAVSR